MGVLDVLSGAATVVGRGVEGLGVDKQIRLADALARRKAEDEAERTRVLNVLTQRQIAEPQLGDPGYATARGEVAGAEATAQVPARIATETALAPLRPSPTEIHATNRRFDIANPLPERGGSDQSWQTVQTPDGLVQVHPKTAQTRPVVGPTGEPLQGTASRPSESERRNAALLQQMENASETVRNYVPKINANLARIPIAGNYALGRDPETQVALQAAEQLASSYLYLVSGAAVTEGEAQRTMRLFVPQPGDSPEVLTRKRSALDSMLSAARTAAGRAAGPSAVQTPQTAPPAGTPSRQGVSPEEIEAIIRRHSGQ